jgi:F0F1-type ATP synthase delta subunit
VDFLKSLIKSSNEKRGNLLLSKDDAKNHRNGLEKYIRDEDLDLTVSVDDELTGGIVIEKEKTSYIGSLEIILELLSDELAIVISKELFQTQGKG